MKTKKPKSFTYKQRLALVWYQYRLEKQKQITARLLHAVTIKQLKFRKLDSDQQIRLKRWTEWIKSRAKEKAKRECKKQEEIRKKTQLAHELELAITPFILNTRTDLVEFAEQIIIRPSTSPSSPVSLNALACYILAFLPLVRMKIGVNQALVRHTADLMIHEFDYRGMVGTIKQLWNEKNRPLRKVTDYDNDGSERDWYLVDYEWATSIPPLLKNHIINEITFMALMKEFGWMFKIRERHEKSRRKYNKLIQRPQWDCDHVWNQNAYEMIDKYYGRPEASHQFRSNSMTKSL